MNKLPFEDIIESSNFENSFIGGDDGIIGRGGNGSKGIGFGDGKFLVETICEIGGYVTILLEKWTCLFTFNKCRFEFSIVDSTIENRKKVVSKTKWW